LLVVGDKHPSAEIIGVDTAAVQPNILPPNVQFEIDDIESDWLYGESSFDFIHGRELILSIRNWPRLVQQSFRALKPGGYFELSGSLPVISSDDGTHIPNSAFEEMAQVYFDMGDRIGASGKAPLSWKTQLEEAGFENVVEKVLKIPTNPWPKDPRMKKIGAFELSHFRDGISNVFARGYTQILGGDPLYFEILMARAKAEVSNRRMHTYLLL
jgi:SAM-dependent methyltransferase